MLEALKAGGRIALVSDAGMPGISDPGGWLVDRSHRRRASRDSHSRRQCGAQRAGGLRPADRRISLHRLSAGKGRGAADAPGRAGCIGESRPACTLIFYEAPHRILDTLADLESVWGPELRVVVARELTKIHEEFLRATVAEARRELASRDRIRGEITLLVAPPAQIAGTQLAGAAAAEDCRPHRADPGREPESTKRKPSSAWRANWANRRARFIANCSASGRGAVDLDFAA